MSEPNLTGYGLWIAAAVLLGAAFFLLYGRKRIGLAAVVRTLALTVPLGLIGARLLYVALRIKWFQEIGLENILWPMTEEHFYWGDAQGFALWGAVGGAALAALLAAKRSGKKAGEVMDALAPAAALTIALCRFGEFLIGEGVGPEVENEALWFFPVAVSNEWSSQYAVFMYEGFTALVILAMLLTWGRRYAGGDRARLFLILYSATQVLLESLRRDSFLAWQFLRVSQLICALVLAGMMLAALARRKRPEGAALRKGPVVPVAGGLFLAVVGFVVWLEFAIDKSAVLELGTAYLLEAVSCVALGVTSALVILPKKAGGREK